MQEDRIAIIGDWHNNIPWMKAVLRSLASAGITRFIHVGDNGVLYPNDGPGETDYTVAFLEEVQALRMDGIVVDGNHDNHAALRALPVDAEGFGIIAPGLRYANRGIRTLVGGRKFGFLGGAYSPNRDWMTPNWDVWPDLEEPTTEDVERLGTGALDVLITHDAPAGTEVVAGLVLPPELEELTKISRQLLLQAVNNTCPSLVFCGHWHQRTISFLAGTGTYVEVLHREFNNENVVLLDTATMKVAPFPVSERAVFEAAGSTRGYQA